MSNCVVTIRLPGLKHKSGNFVEVTKAVIEKKILDSTFCIVFASVEVIQPFLVTEWYCLVVAFIVNIQVHIQNIKV